jgi:hypothetical protein
VIRAAFVLVAALTTGATLWAGGVLGSRPISPPASKPSFVAVGCRAPANAPGCEIALRYLAALDLDRRHEACTLLAASTLEEAGGMAGCRKLLGQARGVRIRYAIRAVTRHALGWTVGFSTQGRSDTPAAQVMLVSPAGLILLVATTW